MESMRGGEFGQRHPGGMPEGIRGSRETIPPVQAWSEVAPRRGARPILRSHFRSQVGSGALRLNRAAHQRRGDQIFKRMGFMDASARRFAGGASRSAAGPTFGNDFREPVWNRCSVRRIWHPAGMQEWRRTHRGYRRAQRSSTPGYLPASRWDGQESHASLLLLHRKQRRTKPEVQRMQPPPLCRGPTTR